MERPEIISAEVWQQIKAQVCNNQKIEAIKTYRDATGEGLKESKDIIDNLASELKKENPHQFIPQKSGCGTTLLFLSLIPFIYYLWQ
jgi:hypothetical protein